MTRGGRAAKRDEPERRCIVTGRVGPKSRLIRFVAGPDGVIVPDVAERLPGRGVWVSADRACLETATEKNLFARAAKAPVKVPDGLAQTVEDILTRRVQDLLSMARKAGHAVAGFEKVKGWLDTGRAALLVQASDGSPREKSRLRPPEGKHTFLGVLTASELGLSFGRERVIHAALAAGGLADRIRVDAVRLSGVREHDGNMADGKAK